MASKTKKTGEDTKKTAAPKNTSTTSRMTRKTEAPMIIRYEPLPSAVAARRPELAQEQIALRAFLKFAARGHVHGHDVEDWLAAEHELRAGL